MNTDGLILCGDFNCQVENCNDKSVTVLRKLLKHFALNDAWLKNGKASNDGLTWCDRESIPKTKIDFVFTSDNLCYPLNSIYLREAPKLDNIRFSDHLGIIFELNTIENTRGSGYWKFNTSLLTDDNFFHTVKVLHSKI